MKVQAHLGINMSFHFKANGKRTGGVAQVLEWLPGKCKVLSSNPTITRKKKKKKKKASNPCCSLQSQSAAMVVHAGSCW
jgi:hypothetical protein